MKRKPEKENESVALYKAINGKIEIYPGDTLPPNVAYHICTTSPIMNATNRESVCAVCGVKIYYGDAIPPGAKQICAPCATKSERIKDHVHVATANSLARAFLASKQN